jgi:hypothetical protein
MVRTSFGVSSLGELASLGACGTLDPVPDSWGGELDDSFELTSLNRSAHHANSHRRGTNVQEVDECQGSAYLAMPSGPLR